MALNIKLNITSDCANYIIGETTGSYVVSTNETGWGVPNVQLTDVDTAKLVISDLTSSIVYDTIDFVHSDDITNETIIDYTTLEVSSVLVNSGKTKIDDGIYCFQFQTSFRGDDPTINKQYKYLSLCNLSCRMKELAFSFINQEGDCCDGCNDALLNNFVEASALFAAIRYAFKCGKDNQVNKLITNLSAFLDSVGCKNC